MNKVLLSIVIPVFNRPEQLNRLFNELFLSTDYRIYEKYIEIIVIDDASDVLVVIPDASNILLIRNEVNLKAPISRMQGYEVSCGDFIHFHDSDDGFSKNWLKLVVDLIIDFPGFDVMVTGRNNISGANSLYKYQGFFHENCSNLSRLKGRLLYRNCMGPLGGVVFARASLSVTSFKSISSSQDWYMYIDVLGRAKVFVSRPDIKFNFCIDGDDRISHNSRKKILGFLQLSKITAPRSVFGRKIRLFYLYSCRQHIHNKGGLSERFYKKNRFSILFYYVVITIYWYLT